MILNFIVDLFVTIVNFLISFINIPSLPMDIEAIKDFFVTITDYGYPIYCFFIPELSIDVLLIIANCESFLLVYKIVIWIYQKIPGAGK